MVGGGGGGRGEVQVTLKLPLYKKLWYILDWICEVPHYRCGKFASQICKRVAHVHFYFNYSFIFLFLFFSSRENYMCHVYLMEFHVNIAIVWY